jgi:hypothetical protein
MGRVAHEGFAQLVPQKPGLLRHCVEDLGGEPIFLFINLCVVIGAKQEDILRGVHIDIKLFPILCAGSLVAYRNDMRKYARTLKHTIFIHPLDPLPAT